MQKKYSIEVSDKEVVVRGYMTIEEAFDFLNYYDRVGYKTVCPCGLGHTFILTYELPVQKEEDKNDKEDLLSLKNSLDHQKNVNEILSKEMEYLKIELEETKFKLEKCREVFLNQCPSVKRCY